MTDRHPIDYSVGSINEHLRVVSRDQINHVYRVPNILVGDGMPESNVAQACLEAHCPIPITRNVFNFQVPETQ